MSFGKVLLFVDLSFLSRQRERSISTLENAYGAIMYSCAFHVSTDLALNTRAVAATYNEKRTSGAALPPTQTFLKVSLRKSAWEARCSQSSCQLQEWLRAGFLKKTADQSYNLRSGFSTNILHHK